MQIGDQAAGLDDQQAPGRDVPGRQPELPEPVQAAGRHVREVERGRTGSAHPRGVLGHARENFDILVEIVEPAKRKTGSDQAILQLIALGHAQPVVVQKGAAPARGRKKLVAGRVVHDGLRDVAAMPQADRHGVLGKAVNEIGGAVERIDDPKVVRVASGSACARLLGQDRVIRVGCRQRRNDGLLRGPIDFGDEVAAALA